MAVRSSVSPNPTGYTAEKVATSTTPESVVGVGNASFLAGFDTTVLRTNRTNVRTNWMFDPAPVLFDEWANNRFIEFSGTFYSTEPVVDVTAMDGTACKFVVAGGGGGLSIYSSVASGEHYELVPEVEQTFSFYLKYTGGGSPSVTAIHDSHNEYSFLHSYDYGAPTALVSGSYVRASVTFTPDATPTQYLGFEVSGLSTGETLHLMGVLLEEGSSPVTPAFSGDSVIAGYGTEWTLAQWASACELYTPVEVTGHPFNLFGGDNLSIEDTRFGKFFGFVGTSTETPEGMSYSAFDYAAVFNISATIPPSRGNLRQFISSICLAAGMRFPLSMSDAIANRVGPWVGFTGNLWTLLNELLTAEQLEAVFLNDGTLQIRELRTSELDIRNATSFSRVGSGGTGAVKYVDFVWNRRENYVEDVEIFPVAGEDPQILSVEAGQTVTTDLHLSASVISVNQPLCVSWVEADPHYYDGTNGVYSVAGSDGLPVTPSQWYAQGGLLSVELTNDPSVIRVTVKGPNNESLSPYQIAMTSGNYYNSLRITGDAILYSQETMRVPTGANPRLVESPDPRTVTSDRARDETQAMYLASRAAETNSGRSLTMSVSLPTTNLDFSEIPGSTFNAKGISWRVDSASISPSGLEVSATAHVTADQFEQVWAGRDASDFETFWSDRNDKDFWVSPLEG